MTLFSGREFYALGSYKVKFTAGLTQNWQVDSAV
jgi:hypothetical protein